MCAKILRNQTIKKTPLGRYLPLTKCVCLPHHSSIPTPTLPTHRKNSTKPSYWLFGRYQMGTDWLIHRLHSDTNMKLNLGLREHNRFTGLRQISFYTHQKKGQRLTKLIPPITGLHSVICSARDYVMQCLSQTRGKNDSHSGPFRTLPLVSSSLLLNRIEKKTRCRICGLTCKGWKSALQSKLQTLHKREL